MGFRDKITANAQPHLDDGEQVQGVFAGQDAVIFRTNNRYCTVVATDRRILVFDSGTFSQTKCKTLLAELPRDTDLGEPSGLWHKIEVDGVALQVNRRYHSDVRAINAAPGG